MRHLATRTAAVSPVTAHRRLTGLVPLGATNSAAPPVPRQGRPGGLAHIAAIQCAGPGHRCSAGRPIRSGRSATGEPLTRTSTSAISARPDAWARPGPWVRTKPPLPWSRVRTRRFGRQSLRARRDRVGVKECRRSRLAQVRRCSAEPCPAPGTWHTVGLALASEPVTGSVIAPVSAPSWCRDAAWFRSRCRGSRPVHRSGHRAGFCGCPPTA